LAVVFPHTFVSKIVLLVEPTPLLSYRSTAKPLSERYSAISKKGLADGYMSEPVSLDLLHN